MHHFISHVYMHVHICFELLALDNDISFQTHVFIPQFTIHRIMLIIQYFGLLYYAASDL